jgi:predicted CoA-binding protein
MDNLDSALALLKGRLALVGVSRSEKDFSRMVLRELLKRGLDVVPVNPGAAGLELDGLRAVARVADAQPPVDGAIFFTGPSQSGAAVEEALAAGVRHIWLHRGGGPGASSPAALAACRAAGVVPITNLCPFMALPEAGWYHRLHAYFRGRGGDQARSAASR